jgi:hypothetical protein
VEGERKRAAAREGRKRGGRLGWREEMENERPRRKEKYDNFKEMI